MIETGEVAVTGAEGAITTTGGPHMIAEVSESFKIYSFSLTFSKETCELVIFTG